MRALGLIGDKFDHRVEVERLLWSSRYVRILDETLARIVDAPFSLRSHLRPHAIK